MNDNPGALSFYCADLDEIISIKEYLKRLLLTLWDERDVFSGKRPFGVGDWGCDVMACLVRHKFIDGVLDEDGYVIDCDYDAGDDIVRQIIKSL